MDYKKLLDEQFKLAVELDDYRDEWIRVNSDDPDSQFSGSLMGISQQPLNALNPALQDLARRDIHLVRKRFLIMKKNASLKEKTLKEKP